MISDKYFKYHTKETAMNVIEHLIWLIDHTHDEKECLKIELEIKCWQHFLKGFKK